ncbi:MAG: sulfatase [Planctomycetota bacterium]
MKNILFTLLFVGVPLSFAWCAESPRPNIIVFYTDDHGFADLGVQNIVEDIRTPHTDELARDGLVMRHGYSTAPQCVPSRAGLLAGKFQSRFGLDSNGDSLDGFNRETTIAQRLQEAGYKTAQFGKWHLGPTEEITRHGFDHVFAQNAQRPFFANITLQGKDRPPGHPRPEEYHIDGCSKAAAALIERYRNQPFFLYIAYRAPHVPLDAPPKYLQRFPGDMPERRRQALAMISAIDDGVGLISETLQKHGLTEETLIFYISDNGAPLKIHKADIAGGGPGWDGSLNDPLNGEKGMLTEGGIHVPFIVAWPGVIPAGQSYPHPVTALDVAATAAAVAGIETLPEDLDGVNIVPYLKDEVSDPPHDFLCWRWIAQSAIREDNWKLLRGGDREYLFNLENDLEEQNDLLSIDAGEKEKARYTEIARRLRQRLQGWAGELAPPGLAIRPMSRVWNVYFDYYLDGQPAPPPPSKSRAGNHTENDSKFRGWLVRNGELVVENDKIVIKGQSNTESRKPFLVRNGISLTGPVRLEANIRSVTAGNATLAWRSKKDKRFSTDRKLTFDLGSSGAWSDHRIQIPVEGTLIHLRLHLPPGTTCVRSLKLRGREGESTSLQSGASACQSP